MHLELYLDMSTNKFLLALQRFTGRRGLPNTVYTDKAQTFNAAKRIEGTLRSPLCRQDTQVSRGARNPLEVYSTSSGLVERLVGTDGRHD